LKPATSKHLRMPTWIITQVLDHKYKEAVMFLNGQESILDSFKPVQCQHAFFRTMSPAPWSSVTLIWLPTFDRPIKSLPNNKCRSASNEYESWCSWLGWSMV
jgi:hypothetical protein